MEHADCLLTRSAMKRRSMILKLSVYLRLKEQELSPDNEVKTVPTLPVPFLALLGIWSLSQGAYAQARAYVANFASNSVSVMDTSSNTVVTTVPVGSQPNSVAVTPDGTRAYVANGGGDVWVISTSNNTVLAKVVVGQYPTAVAITLDGTRVYVLNSSGNLSVIGTSSNAVVATVSLAGNEISPFGLAITPDGTRAYVTRFAANTIAVIDTSSNTVVGTVGLGPSPMEWPLPQMENTPMWELPSTRPGTATAPSR